MIHLRSWRARGEVVEGFANLVAYEYSTKCLAVMSFVARPSYAKALVRLAAKGQVEMEAPDGNRMRWPWPRSTLALPKGRYEYRMAEIDGVTHVVVFNKDATERHSATPVVLAWDGDVERAVYRRLTELFSTPTLPEWAPQIYKALESWGHVSSIQVYRGEAVAEKLRVVRLSVTESRYDEIISCLVRDRVVDFPEGIPVTGDLQKVTTVTEYLKEIGPSIMPELAKRFKPRHVPTPERDELLLRLKRQLKKPQEDVVLAAGKALPEDRVHIVVGEAGVGKSIVGLAIPWRLYQGKPFRALVMCPAHLLGKWEREITSTVDAEVHTIRSIADLTPLRTAGRPTQPEYWLLSRDTAKLSYELRPAPSWNERRGGWICPDCGGLLADRRTVKGLDGKEEEEIVPWGRDAMERPREGNWKCSECQAVLWTADNTRVRRFAPADYIRRYLRGRFDFFICDEVHQMKGDSAQGRAFALLVGSCWYTVALTGTLVGGYARDLFYLAQRLFGSELRREGIGYDNPGLWTRLYGILERVETVCDPAKGRSSKKEGKKVTTRERPGISPMVVARYLLNYCTFLRLSDLEDDLPPFTEEVVTVEMDAEQKAAYDALTKALRSAARASLHTGSRRLLASYINTSLAYPDAPFEVEPLVDPVSGNVITEPRRLDPSVIRPKEQRLLEEVREGLKAGNVYVYAVYTGKYDITARLRDLIATRLRVPVAVMSSDEVKPEDRERWLADRVRDGVKIVISNSKLVETGLDLLDFPTLIFYQTGYSLYNLRQASRRSWRIGQTKPVRVVYLAYRETLQEAALQLMGAKLEAALVIEGRFSEEGLRALADSTDVRIELAKHLVEGKTFDESAEALWSRFSSRPAGAPGAGPSAEAGSVPVSLPAPGSSALIAAYRERQITRNRRGKPLARPVVQLELFAECA